MRILRSTSLVRNYSSAGDLVQTTDALGNSTAYTYDSGHRLTSVTDADGHTRAYTYDGSGRVSSVADAAGNVSTFSYNTSTQQTTVTDPLGHARSYSYDASNRVTSVTDALGKNDTATWDANNNRTTATDRNGHTTTYTYDAHGNVTSTTDALGDSSKTTYDVANHPTSATDALGRTTTYAYDAQGNLTTATDPAGHAMSFTYDAKGERLTMTDASGHTTSYTYDGNGNRTEVSDPLGNKTTSAYDAAGRVTSTTDPDGRVTNYSYNTLGHLLSTTDGAGGVTASSYDKAGNRVSSSDAVGHVTSYAYDQRNLLTSTTDPLGNVTKTAYDANGNRTKVTDPLGNSTSFGFDADNRLTSTTDPNGNTTTWSYDATGNQTSVTDALGRVTTWSYDALNRLVQVTDPLGGRATYTYDAVGNRAAITDPNGNTSTTGYDVLDRTISQADPLSNTLAYAYDKVGNLLKKTDANGAITTYVYDAANRLIQANYPEGTVKFTYDGAGDRATMQDPTGTTAYAYDGARRLTKNAAPGGTTAYAYDLAGNLTSLTYPNGQSATYSYDRENRVVGVTDWNGLTSGYSYDAAGRQVSASQPNGTRATLSYDAGGRLTNLRWSGPNGSSVAGFTYTYDAVGNRTQIVDLKGTSTFACDKLDRLTQATYQDGSSVQYGYDPAGNRTSMTAGGATTFYTYDKANRMLSDGGNAVTWDNNGNMLSNGATTYKYDSQNRLLQVQTANQTIQMAYDGANQRVTRSSSGAITSYVYDDAGPLARVDSESTSQRTQLYGLDGQILWDNTSDQGQFYYHQDALGSTVALTKPDGSVASTMTYDAFGAPRSPIKIPGSFWFDGEQYDQEDGLIYLRARYYDPSTGRFLSADSAEPDYRNTQSLNPYSYAANDPLRYVDPAGHDFSDWISAVGAIGGDVGENLAEAGKLVNSVRAFKILSPIGAVAGFMDDAQKNNELTKQYVVLRPKYQKEFRSTYVKLELFNLADAVIGAIPVFGTGWQIGKAVADSIDEQPPPPTFSCADIGTASCLLGLNASGPICTGGNGPSPSSTSYSLAGCGPTEDANRLRLTITPSYGGTPASVTGREGQLHQSPSIRLPQSVGGAYVPVGNPPNKPTLIAPPNWFQTVGSAPTLQWQANGSRDGASITASQVSVYDQGGGLVQQSGWIAGTSWQPQNLPYSPFSWHVQVRDNRGLVSPASDTWNFTVASPNITITNFAFSPPSPSNAEQVAIEACTSGQAGVGITLRVSVNEANDGSANGAWDIIKELGVPCFDTNPSQPDHPVWNTLNYADGPHLLMVQAHGSTQTWQGAVEEQATYMLLHRRPASPQLVAPARNSFVNSRSIAFQWNTTTNANSYRLRVGTTSDPTSSPLVDVTLPSSTLSYTANFTSDYPALYWKVTASNDVGSDDSGTFQVGIDETPPSAAVASLPAGSTQNIFLVKWSASDNLSGVQCVDVQVRDGLNGGWADWFGCTALTFAGFQGQDGHTYYFRARARDNAGNVGSFAPGNGDTSTTVNLSQAQVWWNSSYRSSRPISVLNNAAVPMPVGYVLHLHLDGTTTPTAQQLYDASQSANKGDDVRVVYGNGTELNRLIYNFSTTTIDILFRSAAAIQPGTLDNTSYQLYYGNAAATSPPADRNQVLYPAVDSSTLRAYDMLEDTGLTLNDASGHSQATMNSALGWSPTGKFGPAVVDPGDQPTGPAIDAGTNNLPVQGFTIEFWMKRTASYGGDIADQAANGSQPRWILDIADGGYLQLYVWPWVGAGSADVKGSISLNDSSFYTSFHHFAVTFDGTNQVRFYVDGQLDVARTLSQSGLASSPSPLKIGASGGDTNRLGALLSGFTLSEGVRSSFPYGQFAAVTVDPSVLAGAELEAPTSTTTTVTTSTTTTVTTTTTSATSVSPAATETLTLGAGWHLLTISVGITSTRLGDVLASINGDYDIVLGFDASAGGAESYFTSPSMQAFNTLTDLRPLHGYWVHLTTAGTLTIAGTRPPAGTTLSLTPGWILVGYSGTSAEPVSTAFGHLNNTVDIALGFDASQGGALSYFTAAAMTRFNNLSTLQPSAGYWLHVTGSASQSWGGE